MARDFIQIPLDLYYMSLEFEMKRPNFIKIQINVLNFIEFVKKTDLSLDLQDDPEKLWCICKQPHNNRFMICCDQCLDW